MQLKRRPLRFSRWPHGPIRGTVRPSLPRLAFCVWSCTRLSATAEAVAGAVLDGKIEMDETVVYEPRDRSVTGLENPMGSSDMANANPTPQTQGRYAFGSGARPLEGYTIKRAIGRGGFGEVYYATSDSGKEVALKLILRNLEVERRGVMQCMNLKCPNLLTIFDLKTNDDGDTFVVMEYVSGPSLASVLKNYPGGLPLHEVRHWLRGLVEGVAYLHDHGIVHRDLKPANLFMEEGIVKIGDYGLAKLITPSQGTEHSESIGTCHYMAPEIGSGKYNKPIDVYAIGVILYEMLAGRVPFDGETVNEVLMKHLTARPEIGVLPEAYRRIVAKALAKDPSQRQNRVYDLLPIGDAPRAPEVRIIGDARIGDARVADEEEILRIGPEEPIFYIGPDTRPSQDHSLGLNRIQERLRANWEALRRPARYQGSPRSEQTQGALRRYGLRTGSPGRPAYARPVGHQPPRAIAAASSFPAPPALPALPSGRIRLAELAGSMLWSAPVLGLLGILAVAVLGVDPSAEPQQIAYLYSMSLLGTWTALIPNKLMESRKPDRTMLRLISVGTGLLVGVIGIVLSQTLQLGFAPQYAFFRQTRNFEVAYFGTLFGLTANWSRLGARDRASRFRFWPILMTGALGLLLLPLWPYRRPDAVAIAVMVATTVQLVSPWNEAASLYAKYARASERRKGKGRTA
jgi:eukaryotic-like serine/threonine-protein kinase